MVYIIEDDQSVRNALDLLLTSFNYDHQAYESAFNFLDAYNSTTKNLVILDLNLGKMHGSELITRILEKDPTVPIIVITATIEKKHELFCKEKGVKAFLRKPVDSHALLDIVRFNLDY